MLKCTDLEHIWIIPAFPNALTEKIVGYDEEGKAIVERAIDVDVLRQEISCSVVEGREERYQFTWPDKKKAMLLANAPVSLTLRPCKEESIDFDNTENLYIECDNLDVLKLLQETYLGKIKMIYIDPPYNTGNDFIYADDFAENAEHYMKNSGQYDDENNRLVQNMESNGRFHTAWLNMIYPRVDLGVLLSSKIEEKIIAGKKVFNVADGFLIACFDIDVTEETVKAVAQEKPYYAVFRDSSMANDSVATNFEQIFATYSPETVRKVL